MNESVLVQCWPYLYPTFRAQNFGRSWAKDSIVDATGVDINVADADGVDINVVDANGVDINVANVVEGMSWC